jgi:hypothetical protein
MEQLGESDLCDPRHRPLRLRGHWPGIDPTIIVPAGLHGDDLRAAVAAQFVGGKATRDALFLTALDFTALPAMQRRRSRRRRERTSI